MKKCYVHGVAVCLLFSTFIVNAEEKSNERINEKERVERLERRVEDINNQQLNYKIEKDLLKETYSNNYERINLFITVLLGLGAVFGFLGIRDITNIKEKYEKELADLKKLTGEFELKSDRFDKEKDKIDEEIKLIIQNSQEQSRKIKFLELKEKALSLFKGKELTMSLEFFNAALEISPSDFTCLNTKGRILIRLNQWPDALACYRKSMEMNPENTTAKYNLLECLYFCGKVDEAEAMIKENNEFYESKNNGRLVEFMGFLKMYFNKDIEGLRGVAARSITHENLGLKLVYDGWDYEDAKYFIHFREDDELKNALNSLIWYWAGEVDGKALLTQMNLPLPVKQNLDN